MTAPWPRIRAVFEAVCDLDAPARAAELARVGSAEPAVEREVAALLEHSAAPFDFLEAGIGGRGGDAVAPALGPGSRVGAYRLCERIGAGGMGVVYRATRADGQYDGAVAVKLLRPGLVDPADRERFANEVRVLAGLDHPGIARLIDAGVAGPVPFLVMELIDGRPIDAYCAERDLDETARLRLIQQVAAAVHHAHGQLVVHRDLKPGNILVSADGRARLLDFGIAKILDAPGGHTARPLMTPEYASPEQRAGGPTTVATDVYALGVVLHELLIGQRPAVPLSGSPLGAGPPWGAAEGRRDPEPSGSPFATAALEVDAYRPARAAVVPPRRLRPGLAAILRRATHPAAAERYTSAAHLIDDIERYLTGRPVVARRWSLVQRGAHAIRRHRRAVVIGMVFAGLLGTAVLRSLHHGRQAAEQRDRAERVVGFLHGMLTAPDPRQGGADRSLRDVLGAAVRDLDTLHDHPLVEAELRLVIGNTLHSLGEVTAAEPQLRTALELRRDHGAESGAVAWAADALGHLLTSRGDYAAAEPLLREALATRRSDPDTALAALADSLSHVGKLEHLMGRLDAAHQRRVEELAVRRALHDGPHVSTASSLINLAAVLHARGDRTTARAHYHEALAMYDGLVDTDHPDRSDVLNNLGMLERSDGDLPGAEALLREALRIRTVALGVAHPNTARTTSNLGSVLADQGRHAEAIDLHRGVLASRIATLGAEHPDVALSRYRLGVSLRALDRPDEALAEWTVALGILQERLPPGHRHTLTVLEQAADLLIDNDRPADAVDLALHEAERVAAADHESPALATIRELLADSGQAAALQRLVGLIADAAAEGGSE